MTRLESAAAITVAIVWGVNFVVIKVGLADFPPFLFSALRFLLAAVPAVFFIRWCDVPIRRLVGIGLVLGVVKFSLLFIGIKAGLPAGLASLVLQAQVFFTIILALVFHGEALKRGDLVALALGLGGLALISLQMDASIPLSGMALVLAAALAWAVANLQMRRVSGVSPFRFMVWMSLVPVLPLLGLSLLFEGPTEILAAITGATLGGVGALIYLALVATLFGYAVWGWLLARHPAAVVTPYALLVPVFGILGGWLFLGETVSPTVGLGMALVLAGVGAGVAKRILPRLTVILLALGRR